MSKRHDFTKQYWGHALHWWVARRDGNIYRGLNGHSSERIDEGDVILCMAESGKTLACKVLSIEFYRNPPDMFSADVELRYDNLDRDSDA